MSTLKINLSLWARNVLRENELCRRHVSQLFAHERATDGALSAFQNEMLRKTLASASKQIPAYSGVKNVPKACAADELIPFLRQNFPVISKKELISARSDYYPHHGKVWPWTILGKTSGTTGSPLDVFRSYDSVVWENAFVRRHWQWSGFRQGMRRATLRGDQILGLEHKKPPFWIENRLDQQLLLSTRHLNKDYAPFFSEALRRYQPFLLQAYPSAAFILAQALERNEQTLAIPWVFTGSEMLYPYQRELIEARLGRVMDFYGMAERVAFAGECTFGNLHVNTDYSFVEIVDDQNQPTNGEGFVVGTTFHNYLMPLLRYKLSDRTRWKPGTCLCGRSYPMIEPIRGKFEDVLFGSTGNGVSPSIITFAFKGVANIDSSQVAQIGPAAWEVRVVPGPSYSHADGAQIVKNIHQSIDSGLSVALLLKEKIERTSAGKYRWVVNEWQPGGVREKSTLSLEGRGSKGG
jgi:phenylacetate-CoA ligase